MSATAPAPAVGPPPFANARFQALAASPAPLLVLLAAAAVMLLWGLGDRSLADWDEAIYAQVAKEMLETGDWLTLHWNYELYFNKPPVLMWLTALSYTIFGVGEFAARLVSAMAGMGVVAMTFLIGRRVYDPVAAFAGGAVLLTAGQFIESARFGTTDILMTLWVLLAIYSYLRVRDADPRWWYVAGAACALAVMTKSAAGLIAPIVLAAALLLDRRALAALRSGHFWLAILFAILLGGWWHLLMVMQHGTDFIDVYFGRHLMERATSPMEGHSGDGWFYAERLRVHFHPWFLLLPFALALALRDGISARARSWVVLALAGCVFALYTIVQTKLYWYIVPMYPAIALLVGRLAGFILYRPASFAAYGLGVAALLLAAITPAGTSLVAAVAAGALAWIAGRWLTRSSPERMAAAAALAFLLAIGLHGLQPRYGGGESPVARIARAAGADATRADTLLVYGTGGLYRPAPLFYSNRHIEMAWDTVELAAAVAGGETREILIPRAELPKLRGRYSFRMIDDAGPYLWGAIQRRDGR